MDPYYRFELTSDGQTTSVKVVPQFAGAELERPIAVSMSLTFPDTDEGRAAADAFRHALDYGTEAEVQPEYVDRLEVDAPAGLGGKFEGGSIRIGPSVSDGAPSIELVLAVLADDSSLLGALPISFELQSAGSKGAIWKGSIAPGTSPFDCRSHPPMRRSRST